MIEDVLRLAPSDRDVVSMAILTAFEDFDAYSPDDVAVHPQLAADLCRAVNDELAEELQLSQYACSKRLLRLRKDKKVHQTQDTSRRKKLAVMKLTSSQREAVDDAVRDLHAEPAFHAYSPDDILFTRSVRGSFAGRSISGSATRYKSISFHVLDAC